MSQRVDVRKPRTRRSLLCRPLHIFLCRAKLQDQLAIFPLGQEVVYVNIAGDREARMSQNFCRDHDQPLIPTPYITKLRAFRTG